MKIVIDIPEEIYKCCLPYKDCPIYSNDCNYFPEITYSIANGTPIKEKQTNTAEWIKYPSDFSEYRCSNCRYEVFGGALKYAEAGEYKFCPNCGSRMKGVEE